MVSKAKRDAGQAFGTDREQGSTSKAARRDPTSPPANISRVANSTIGNSASSIARVQVASGEPPLPTQETEEAGRDVIELDTETSAGDQGGPPSTAGKARKVPFSKVGRPADAPIIRIFYVEDGRTTSERHHHYLVLIGTGSRDNRLALYYEVKEVAKLERKWLGYTEMVLCNMHPDLPKFLLDCKDGLLEALIEIYRHADGEKEVVFKYIRLAIEDRIKSKPRELYFVEQGAEDFVVQADVEKASWILYGDQKKKEGAKEYRTRQAATQEEGIEDGVESSTTQRESALPQHEPATNLPGGDDAAEGVVEQNAEPDTLDDETLPNAGASTPPAAPTPIPIARPALSALDPNQRLPRQVTAQPTAVFQIPHYADGFDFGFENATESIKGFVIPRGAGR